MALNQDVAFKIAAEVTGQSAVDQLRKSLEDMNGSVNKLTGSYGKLGDAFKGAAAAFGVFKLADMVKDVIDAGVEMEHLSQKTGVSVESLSTFKAAGKLVGMSLEDLGGAFGKFDKAIASAETGNKKAAAAFGVLGISMTDLKSQAPDELLLRTADAFSKLQDGPMKAKLAIDLFGKSGAQMIPLLNMGRDAIESMGVKMTTDFAQRAVVFEQSLTKINAKMKMITVSAVSELMPTLQEITNAFMSVAATKPDMVGFMDGVAESIRLLAVAGNALAFGLKEVVDTVVTGGKQMAAAATMDWGKVNQLGDEWLKRSKDRAQQAAQVQQDLLKNSLLFGDGTVEEIKKRQMGDTAPKTNENRTGQINPDDLNTTKVDKYKTAIQQLGQEIAKLSFQNDHLKEFKDGFDSAKAAQMAFETSQGQFVDMTTQQKSKLMELAQQVDEYANKLKMAQAAQSYNKATELLMAEANAQRTTNLERQKAAALQELENAGIRKGTDLYNELSAARIKALTSKTTADENKQIAEFVQRSGEQTGALKDNALAANLSTIQYQMHAEALKIDAQVAEATKNMTDEGAASFRDAAEVVKAHRLEVMQLNYEQSRTFDTGMKNAMRTYVEQATDAATQANKVFTDAFKGMENAMVNFVMTGKLNFTSLADSIIKDLVRMMVQQQITGPLAQMMGLSSGAGGGNPATGGSGLSSLFSSIGPWASSLFANGGIMTSAGSATLRRYSSGGIATTPQLAMFGEGSTPEAYVPLPDGRSIPVAMQGGQQQSGGNVTVNVNNNAGGATATATQRTDSNGNRVIDVMIEQVKAAIASDIMRGTGTVPNALERTYGASRAAGAY